MKLASYNMHFGGKAGVHWNEMLKECDPDILLVQESLPPVDHMPVSSHGASHERAVWSPVETEEKTMTWGSGVYFKTATPRPVELPRYAGWVTGAEVEAFKCPGDVTKTLRVFSVHAPTAKESYQRAMNSILDMLMDYRDGCDVVIGGDFNITISERHEPEDRNTETADRKIQHRLRDEFGLINCWQESNSDEPLAQTLRWGSDKTVPYHCDGLFVPATWQASLQSCDAISESKWDDLSDHNPIVAEFN